MRTMKGATTVALGAVVALTAAACSGSSSTGSGATTTASAAAAAKGGTLYILNLGTHNGLDVQQSYVGADVQTEMGIRDEPVSGFDAGGRHGWGLGGALAGC